MDLKNASLHMALTPAHMPLTLNLGKSFFSPFRLAHRNASVSAKDNGSTTESAVNLFASNISGTTPGTNSRQFEQSLRHALAVTKHVESVATLRKDFSSSLLEHATWVTSLEEDDVDLSREHAYEEEEGHQPTVRMSRKEERDSILPISSIPDQMANQWRNVEALMSATQSRLATPSSSTATTQATEWNVSEATGQVYNLSHSSSAETIVRRDLIEAAARQGPSSHEIKAAIADVEALITRLELKEESWGTGALSRRLTRASRIHTYKRAGSSGLSRFTVSRARTFGRWRMNASAMSAAGRPSDRMVDIGVPGVTESDDVVQMTSVKRKRKKMISKLK